MTRLATALIAIMACGAAEAQDCNIADVFFGKVRIELIHENGFDIGVVFGNDFDSPRFQYGNILGQIASPERDGSRRVTDVNQKLCGILEQNLRISTEDVECDSCFKGPVKLQKIDSGFVIMSGGNIEGTIEGKLPR